MRYSQAKINQMIEILEQYSETIPSAAVAIFNARNGDPAALIKLLTPEEKARCGIVVESSPHFFKELKEEKKAAQPDFVAVRHPLYSSDPDNHRSDGTPMEVKLSVH